MRMPERPRFLSSYPFLFLIAALTLLLLVALSIIAQPPDTSSTASPYAGPLAWGRSLTFALGAGAFVLCLVVLCRRDPIEGGVAMPVPESEGSDTVTPSFPAAPAPAPPAPAEAVTEGAEAPAPFFTLVAHGSSEDEVLAIRDFATATELAIAISEWRTEYPGEFLRVWAGGVEYARTNSLEPEEDVVELAPVPVRVRLAVEGVA